MGARKSSQRIGSPLVVAEMTPVEYRRYKVRRARRRRALAKLCQASAGHGAATDGKLCAACRVKAREADDRYDGRERRRQAIGELRRDV